MKIIRRSNYNYEDHRGDEWFVHSSSLTLEEATKKADEMNRFDVRSADFFVVVADDYKLKPDWKP